MSGGLRRPWALAVLATLSAMSCKGCPAEPGDLIPHDFGTLNPLFDRAGFVDFPGAVVDPFSSAPVRFRVEMILPVVAASIDADDVRAYVVPSELGGGNFDAIISPPPDLIENPVPLTPVPVRRLDLERNAGGAAIALTATLDEATITSHAGHDLIVQLAPVGWQFTAEVTDNIFQTPMRFTYHISRGGRDGDPPYLADATAMADRAFSEAIGELHASIVVAPHSPIRFTFSEPMYQVTPVLAPQDPVGFRPRAPEALTRGFTTLESHAAAGLAPGQPYCLSFVPPRMAALGPIAWGTQDLSGEPLVPFAPTAAARRQHATRGDAVDLCFRSGPLRIESPRPGATVGVAAAPLSVDLIAAAECNGRLCPDTFIRFMARAQGSDDELGEDWSIYAEYAAEDPDVTISPGKLLVQGELRVPIEHIRISSLPTNRVPIGGHSGPPIFGLPTCDPHICRIDVRFDLCRRNTGVCVLGDLIPVDLDRIVPPAPEAREVFVTDTDTNDGVIDRLCVDMAVEDSVEVEIYASSDDPGTSFTLGPGEDNVTEEPLGEGRVRRCVERVRIPGGGSGDSPRITVVLRTRDEAEQLSDPLTVDEICRRPPRRHIGFDGRRSAMALDRHGVPHVAYVTHRRIDDDAALVPNEVRYARWDEASDLWVQETAACLCGREPGSNVCSECDGTRAGWTIDMTINWRDEPLVCYTEATAPLVPDPDDAARMIPEPGYEWRVPAAVRVLLRSADGSFSSHELVPADPSLPPELAALNMGCSIEARRGRIAGIADYLVGYARPDAPRTMAAFAYGIDFEGPGGRTIGFTPSWSTPGRLTDIAVDGKDQFWVATSGSVGPPRVHGETPAKNLLLEQEPLIIDGPGMLFTWGARIAARGEGEVAVAFTDSDRRPRFAHRLAHGPATVRAELPFPLQSLRGYNRSEFEAPVGEEFDPADAAFDYFINNGRIASIDDASFGGIPIDVAFSAATGARCWPGWRRARRGSTTTR